MPSRYARNDEFTYNLSEVIRVQQAYNDAIARGCTHEEAQEAAELAADEVDKVRK